MKKTICILLCLVMCFGLFAGCGSKDESQTPPLVTDDKTGNVNTGGGSTADSIATPPPKDAEYYDHLAIYLDAKIASQDPLNPGSSTSQAGIIAHMMYDNLVTYTLDGKLEPALATEWHTDDYQTFTFKLRDDVTFHNGEPFTADDVVFTIEACKEAAGTGVFQTFGKVTDISTNGDYEITVTLKEPNFDFIFDISKPTAPILNREAYEADSEKGGWIGTGPYYLESMVPNDSMEFERYDDYWGEPTPTKHFTMRYIAEVTAKNIMMKNDEFNFATINGVYIPEFLADDHFVMNSYTMDNGNYICFNMRKPVTSDINFRKAVAYAIDKNAILEIAQDGYGITAQTGAFWGNKTAYKNPNIPPIEQDLAKAKEYLEKSSYNGEELEICASLAHTIKTAAYLQNTLSELGINCKVHEFDGPSWSAAAAYAVNDLDIMVSSGAWSPLASSINTYVTPGSNSNRACYENQEVVDLLSQADRTPDGPERQALYYKVQEIMAEELPYIVTIHPSLYIAGQKGTGGALFYPTNNTDYSNAYRIKE